MTWGKLPTLLSTTDWGSDWSWPNAEEEEELVNGLTDITLQLNRTLDTRPAPRSRTQTMGSPTQHSTSTWLLTHNLLPHQGPRQWAHWNSTPLVLDSRHKTCWHHIDLLPGQGPRLWAHWNNTPLVPYSALRSRTPCVPANRSRTQTMGSLKQHSACTWFY
jgi:hypothetical protein